MLILKIFKEKKNFYFIFLMFKIDQIKLLRREQKRQDFENRNLGNFSRLFPIDDKYDMDYYLNILNTAFNLFYPIGKHVQWKKTYERIKVIFFLIYKKFLNFQRCK